MAAEAFVPPSVLVMVGAVAFAGDPLLFDTDVPATLHWPVV